MTNSKRAFTLVEMLVVLGIFVILAALLFPMFARVREVPRRKVSCQSNLKQIGLGFAQYFQDYDDRFPPERGVNVVSSLMPFPKPFGWADAIYPYLKSTQIFQCPSEKTAPQNDAAKAGFTDYWVNARFSGAQEKMFLIGPSLCCRAMVTPRKATRVTRFLRFRKFGVRPKIRPRAAIWTPPTICSPMDTSKRSNRTEFKIRCRLRKTARLFALARIVHPRVKI